MQRAHTSAVKSLWPGVSALKQLSRNDNDPAWLSDNKPTNYRLGDGDEVVLTEETKGMFFTGTFAVPAGTTGVVVNARTPRVFKSRTSTSLYFANVDVVIDGIKGRVRVPHGALRTMPKKH